MPPAPSAVDALFTATQRRVLACLFGEPERAFYVRELMALTGTGHGGVQRELQRLQQAGLVSATPLRNRVLLQADPESPIYAELTAMVRKTVGLAEPLRLAFAPMERHMHLCFAFDPERDPERDLGCPAQRDFGLLLVPGEQSVRECVLLECRKQAEARLGRSLWIITADPRRLRTDWFVGEVLKRPRVWVFGDEAMLEALLSFVPNGHEGCTP